MAAITIATNVSGTPDELDRRAMNLAIAQENERRAASNPPIAQLPNSTGAERKTSYETILNQQLTAAHDALVTQAGEVALFRDVKPLWQAATDAKRAAAITALT
jgi:hypothetical protein